MMKKDQKRTAWKCFKII